MTSCPLERSIVTSRMNSMTRSELIELMAKRFPSVDRRCAEQMVKEVIASMTQALVSGNRIELRGFGSFGVKRLNPRIRNLTHTSVEFVKNRPSNSWSLLCSCCLQQIKYNHFLHLY